MYNKEGETSIDEKEVSKRVMKQKERRIRRRKEQRLEKETAEKLATASEQQQQEKVNEPPTKQLKHHEIQKAREDSSLSKEVNDDKPNYQLRSASAAGGAATEASAPVPTSAPAPSKTIDLLQMIKSAQSQSNSVNVTPAITTPVTTPAPAPEQMPALLQKLMFKEPGTAMSADELEKDILKTAKPHRNHLLQDSANSPSAISLAAISTRSVHGSERHQDVDVAEGEVLEPLDTSFVEGSGGQIPVLNEEQMIDQFVVDCYFVGRESNNLILQDRRLKFAQTHLEILSPKPDEVPRTVSCSQFQFKILKAGKKHLNFPLVPDTGYLALKMRFKPEHEQYIDWVVEQFNEMIKGNKDKMQSTKPNFKQVPSIVSTEVLNKDIYQIRPIYNEKNCLAELERQRSQSRAMNVSPVSQQTPPKQLPSLGYMKQLVSRSDAIDSFINALWSLKEFYYAPEKSDRTEIAPSTDLFSLEKPEKSKNFKGDEFRNRRLENTENSCYFNATMQALSACHPFISCCRILKLTKKDKKNFCENQKYSTTKLEQKYTLFADMLDMMSTLSGCEEESVHRMNRSRLTKIRQNLGRINHDFDNDNQQDAHEFLLMLLGSVDDVIEANRKKSKTMEETALLNPSKVFEYEVETWYACQSCHKMERKSDYRSDLSLNVSENCDVQKLLSSLSEWSPVEKECAFCKETMSSACERISKFPPSLIMNLKLYEMQETEGMTKKKDCSVNDAFEIDLSSLRSHTKPEIFDMNQYEFESDFEQDENGNASQEESQNDIIIDSVKKSKDLYFEPLSDIEDVKEMLGKLNIAFCEESVRSHLNGLKLPVEKMSRSDCPADKVPIVGDGNCFYRAISWCLTGSEKFHRKLRLATAEYLKNNEANLKKYCKEKNYDDYVKKVEKNSEWAVSCEIFAMASMLNIEILTYLDNRWLSHVPWGGRVSSGGSIYLNNQFLHFEPTTSLSKSCSRNTDSQSSASQQNVANKTSRCESKRKTDDNESEEDTLERRNETQTAENGEISEYKMDQENCETTTAQERDTHSPEEVKYNLVAVVCHLGDSPHRGHYVAYIKDPNKSSKWIYCSDNFIEEVSRRTVEIAIRTSGYVLFYDRQ
ncbi:hypothetical protein GCK72_016220 [Caenorhabditis remanei]|uniref:ubiquitinyl hydrolase 1 n=1 Tax=Caenorhabditis remanei TaxID=31234 RepID=A0A6A5GZC2_CAERE|nr:hypothetical protein GCK72_016220 [Caenorhabditis remanei]KAF1759753.1 hypothetical protein GCK72_016220 [Caenorhabditis remanei]